MDNHETCILCLSFILDSQQVSNLSVFVLLLATAKVLNHLHQNGVFLFLHQSPSLTSVMFVLEGRHEQVPLLGSILQKDYQCILAKFYCSEIYCPNIRKRDWFETPLMFLSHIKQKVMDLAGTNKCKYRNKEIRKKKKKAMERWQSHLNMETGVGKKSTKLKVMRVTSCFHTYQSAEQ